MVLTRPPRSGGRSDLSGSFRGLLSSRHLIQGNPAVIAGRPASGATLPSFRRRPESSGLFHTFPPGGHDNRRGIPARVSRAIRPAFPAFAGRLRTSCPRPLVPDAVYRFDRSFPTRSTTYIPVGVHPCRRLAAYRTSCPSRLRASCPRPLVPDAVYHLHPCRRLAAYRTSCPSRLRASCPPAAYRTSCP